MTTKKSRSKKAAPKAGATKARAPKVSLSKDPLPPKDLRSSFASLNQWRLDV